MEQWHCWASFAVECKSFMGFIDDNRTDLVSFSTKILTFWPWICYKTWRLVTKMSWNHLVACRFNCFLSVVQNVSHPERSGRDTLCISQILMLVIFYNILITWMTIYLSNKCFHTTTVVVTVMTYSISFKVDCIKQY